VRRVVLGAAVEVGGRPGQLEFDAEPDARLQALYKDIRGGYPTTPPAQGSRSTLMRVVKEQM
jgi:hypothetical protein